MEIKPVIKVDEKICGFHIIKKGNHEVPFQVRIIFFYWKTKNFKCKIWKRKNLLKFIFMLRRFFKYDTEESLYLCQMNIHVHCWHKSDNGFRSSVLSMAVSFFLLDKLCLYSQCFLWFFIASVDASYIILWNLQCSSLCYHPHSYFTF